MQATNPWPVRTLRILGVLCLLFSAVGLIFNVPGLTTRLAYASHPSRLPSYLHAYIVMSIISVGFHVALFVVGVGFLLFRRGVGRILGVVMAVEILYFIGLRLVGVGSGPVASRIAAADLGA